MRLTGKVLLTVFLPAIIFSGDIPAASAPETGWVLQQKSSHAGDQVLYVTQTGLKTYSTKNKVGVFTKGPGWQVVIYNDQTRLYFDEPLSQWLADLSKNKNQLEGATWKVNRQGNIAGLQAFEYIMSGAPRRTVSNTKSKRPQAPPRAASFWVANDIPIPRNLIGLIAKTYGLPPTARAPLAFTTIGTDGRPHTLLQTVSAQKITIPTSTWVKPAGYKRAKTDMDVLVDQDTKDAIDDLIKEL